MSQLVTLVLESMKENGPEGIACLELIGKMGRQHFQDD
jgi:hypothetical protein